MALLQQCFSFKGRITKRAFRRHLFGVVIFLVVSHILVGAVYALRPILAPVCIVVYYTMIPVGVKRLHDLNHPGRLIFDRSRSNYRRYILGFDLRHHHHFHWKLHSGAILKSRRRGAWGQQLWGISKIQDITYSRERWTPADRLGRAESGEENE